MWREMMAERYDHVSKKQNNVGLDAAHARVPPPTSDDMGAHGHASK